jgi:hypothetical protein
MANQVYTTEEMELENKFQVLLKPLTIKSLRKFMFEWSDGFKKMAEQEALASAPADGTTDPTAPVVKEPAYEGEQLVDLYVRCVAIALEKALSTEVTTQYKNGVITKAYQDYIEENITMPGMEKVMQVCGGIDFDNPKLLAMAQAAQAEMAEAGTI